MSCVPNEHRPRCARSRQHCTLGSFVAAAVVACSGACTLGGFAAADGGRNGDASADSAQSNYRVVGDGGVVFPLPRLGPAASEGPYGSGCPANTVVTGAYFEWESIGWGNGGMPRVIQFYCSSIRPDGSITTPTLGQETATTNQPPSEFMGLMTGSDLCATGDVVVGLYGTTVSNVMNQVGLECASLVDWIRSPSTAMVQRLPMRGAVNALNQTVSTNWERSCSQSAVPTVLSRIDGQVGYWFENLTATCIEVAQ
jgi:hypothetical protein